MRPQRSKAAATLFSVPQLMRTGHAGAAFGWVAVAGVGLMLLIGGLVVTFTVSLTEGAVILMPGALALLVFAAGSTVHARRAPDLWNAAADEQNRQARTDAVKRGTRAD